MIVIISMVSLVYLRTSEARLKFLPDSDMVPSESLAISETLTTSFLVEEESTVNQYISHIGVDAGSPEVQSNSNMETQKSQIASSQPIRVHMQPSMGTRSTADNGHDNLVEKNYISGQQTFRSNQLEEQSLVSTEATAQRPAIGGIAANMNEGHLVKESSSESLAKTTYDIESVICRGGYPCVDPNYPVCCGVNICLAKGYVCCSNGVNFCKSGCTCSFDSKSCSCKKKKSCFSGDSLLTLKNGESIPMSKATVGQEILSYSYEKGAFLYSPIVWLPHAENTDGSDFVKIDTKSGLSLTLTKDHLVPSGSCDANPSSYSLKRADHVKPNECMYSMAGATVVTSTTCTRGHGLYTVVTLEQYIVVDGLVASPFAINHYLPDTFYSLHRLAFKIGLSDNWGKSLILAAATDMADQFIGLVHSAFPSLVDLLSA